MGNNRLKISLTFIVCLLQFSACNFFSPPKKNVVIEIGEREISEEELRKEIRQILFDMGISEQDMKNNIRPIVDKIVERSLIVEYGKEEGLVISDEELETAVREIKKDYPSDVFEETLLQRYIDFNEWKEELRKELLIEKITKSASADIPPVTYNETKEYFNQHRDEFVRPQMILLRQIVTHSKKEAETVIMELEQGQEFSDLARKNSIAPEAEDGGNIGWVAKGKLEESIEDIVFKLPIGKISPVIESPYGFHVFEVLAKRDEGLKDLPEARVEIESRLLSQKREVFYGKWIKGLKIRFPVSIDEDILKNWSTEG